MKTIEFTKMQASGNDFIVVDNRRRVIKNAKAFAARFCPAHTSIGADGVLLLEKSKKAAFKMRIINADGSEAEACGNGFRCIARYANERLGFPKKFEFESLSGRIRSDVKGRNVQVDLINPKKPIQQGKLNVLGWKLHYFFINTGVPHTVIFAGDLPGIDVKSLGRTIRYHEQFKPQGTNVNFVEVKEKNLIHIRTYERGVEDETLACGTGSTASAIVSSLAGYTRVPVLVKTRGGETLTVNFRCEGNKIKDVSLKGEAFFVYDGKIAGDLSA